MKIHLVLCDPSEAIIRLTELVDVIGVGRIPSFQFKDLPVLAIIVGEDGLPHWAATFYALDQALNSNSVTGDTVRTYGEAIVAWLLYLQSVQKCLEDATEQDVKLYRNKLIHGSSTDECRRYSASTVNLRTMTAVRFHIWGQLSRQMPSPLGEWAVGRDRSRVFRRFTAYASHRKQIVRAPESRMPRILGAEQLRALLSCAPQPYRLIFRWAVCTGLRRFELCGLRKSDLPLGAANTSTIEQLNLVRKGGRTVTVYAPSRLIDETRWYVLTDRPKAAPTYESFIFLNARGRRIDRTALSAAFRRAADAAGIDATLHHLRHTYAVTALKYLQERAHSGDSINPLKTLQMLLGHTAIETTEIYLRALDANSAAVQDALDFLYGGTL
ncbi:tyrosine-type recombinase/integrase [Burkholderia contaminans]|uniref:tyrosine-type recombinase/integrase n=1 Tax=Burkholderia contaminans TaxID=488447 RepID=UPI0009F39473|nr:tyrosine-type recombinase/integrase [Burkholderia contaminans]